MKCIVTGVAGFVGSSIADELLARGHDVLGIDCFIDYYPRSIKEKNLDKALGSNKFEFIEANMLDLNLEKTLEGADWIFHQAAQAGVRASWGGEFSIYTTNNILASQRLLEAAKSERVKNTLKKIVYASSSSVYGHAESLPTYETMRPQPISPYGVSKLAAEHLMVLYTKEFNVPTVSLRYFTVYGPRQRPDMAFNKFIRAGLLGEEIVVYGDGEQSRDFTFISDIVNANIAAAEKTTESLVFNIGGGCRVTVNEVLAKLEKLMNKRLNVAYKQKQHGDARHTSADTAIAKKELGYAPSISLDEGLGREIAWMESTLT